MLAALVFLRAELAGSRAALVRTVEELGGGLGSLSLRRG